MSWVLKYLQLFDKLFINVTICSYHYLLCKVYFIYLILSILGFQSKGKEEVEKEISCYVKGNGTSVVPP